MEFDLFACLLNPPIQARRKHRTILAQLSRGLHLLNAHKSRNPGAANGGIEDQEKLIKIIEEFYLPLNFLFHKSNFILHLANCKIPFWGVALANSSVNAINFIEAWIRG